MQEVKPAQQLVGVARDNLLIELAHLVEHCLDAAAADILEEDEKAVLRLIRPQVLDTKNVCVRVCTYVYVYVGMYARVSVYVCM